ncbi:MAG: ABC transporter ATP-binding protein [Deltaproteobacteria bacterium]|nr:ABC transporter ATP-binding protein [Deltaproteobacteria bacterium]
MLVAVEHLTKFFGKFKAVDDVSFCISEGEIVGLVGPNGAGKSTTIHMLLGLISPTYGHISLFGKCFEDHREEILQQLNFTSPYMAMPGRLTVYENLKVFARIYGVRNATAKISELLESFGITQLKYKPVARLSSGESTRVGLCKAFLNDARLLLFDEPTAYLDPQAAMQVREILLELQARSATTILITSHNMRDVQRMCGRIAFLSHGRLVASGTPIEVTRKVLKEDRQAPALDEVFLTIAKNQPDEVVSNSGGYPAARLRSAS